jgi:hypothetical protein
MLRTKLEDWKAEAQREETPSRPNYGASRIPELEPVYDKPRESPESASEEPGEGR